VATAEGKSPDPEEPEVPVDPGEDPEPTVDPEGHITITKVTTSEPENGEAYKLGETIAYEITVLNDGNLTITDITVKDELTNDEWTIASLKPDESKVFTAEYVVTEADILNGEVLNVATAEGKSPDPEEPEVPVDPGEDPEPTEGIDVTLEVNKTITNEPANGEAYVLGETIEYLISIKNTGNVIYYNIVVDDALTGLNDTIAKLGVDETAEFTTSYTVTSEDILAGSVSNTVTAKGDAIEDPKNPDEPKVPEGEDTVVTGDQDDPDGPTPPIEEIRVLLTATDTITSTPANGEAYALGEVIYFTETVTNESNVDLYNVVVKDPATGIDEVIALLKAGETVTYETTHTVTEEDIAAFTVVSVITAQADDVTTPAGETITPYAEATASAPVSQIYTLTIRYRYQDGRTAAPDRVAQLAYGAEYRVYSPAIDRYKAVPNLVEGTMPMSDLTITVIYIPTDTPIVIPEIETPLGIGVGINVGESIE
jgi:hypothetical protein